MKKVLLAAAAVCMLLLTGCAQENMSIGIIGGADVPTKVFVAAAPFWWAPFVLIAAAAAAVIWLAVRILRRKNR